MGQHYNVAEAVIDDSGEAIFKMIDGVNLAAINIAFAGRYVEYGGKEIKRCKVFIVAKLPKLHGVDVLHIPGFPGTQVEYRRQGYAIDQHPSTQVRKIKFFSIMRAKTG